MRRLAFVLLAVMPVYGIVCDDVVQDSAKLLSLSDIQDINKSLISLTDLGVDPRVIVGPIGNEPNLDYAIDDWAKSCPSWQAPRGGWKNNLLIIAVATDKHKYGMKFLRSGILEKPLGGDQSTRIMTTYMKPLLRDGEYAKALEVTAAQLAKRIEASREERYKGVVVNNQATDLNGLWTFLLWLLISTVLFIAIFYFVKWLVERRREQKALAKAQQNAILARNNAVTSINKIRSLIDEYAATGKDVTAAKEKIGEAMDELALLQNSVSTDPSQEHLSEDEYENIRVQYLQVGGIAAAAKALLNEKITFAAPEEKAYPPVFTRPKRRSRVYEPPEPPTLPPAPPPQPVYTGSTVVVVNEPYYHDPFIEREVIHDTVHQESYSGSTDSYDPPAHDYDSPSQDSGSTSSYDDSSSYDSNSNSSDGGSGDY